ncbi:MAG: hypothetical protein MUF49_11035 [Oculatellaceae cyanobacterium Prado106]|jgi:hypothetical protein|nr:hypothetical protein [Oculatellaceae cyanobacterium Prado106]
MQLQYNNIPQKIRFTPWCYLQSIAQQIAQKIAQKIAQYNWSTIQPKRPHRSNPTNLQQPHPIATSEARIDLNPYPLHEALQLLTIDGEDDVPWIIWLVENPNSPLSLPGKISLQGHDFIHAILNRSRHDLPEEAFVLGFTLGNDEQASPLHSLLYKLLSSTLYPPQYRFSWKDFHFFDAGFRYGRSHPLKNLNRLDFTPHLHKTILELRQSLGFSQSIGGEWGVGSRE